MATLFSHILVLATLVCGLVWAFDHFVLLPKRQAALATAEANSGAPLDENTRTGLLREGVIAENCHGVFPVLFGVLIFRSFIFEPFQIPSGSMMPTLLVGDFLLVEKYAYGIKDPVWRNTLVETGKPDRGDIVVFKYPKDERIDYIKRVVGLPGDRIVYRNKSLYVQPKCEQGQTPCPELKEISRVEVNQGEFNQGAIALTRLREEIGEVTHDLLINPSRREPVGYYYQQDGSRVGEWIVPEGKYFAMGDNRDNSTDSRFWGFVDESQLVGRANVIWMSFEFERGADSILPSWVPTGVRLDRIGGLE
ncbi:signal peptidase I [Ferrimonas lipolytica]|uniref:Signal peptidase I n=1 Tax=Ferrimonas lipolytica TaxID=2724191 RepID=A0A6H1UFX2_9GAMM|nr:signal peptidase I [Ferrimonas lipolytica]QIZ77500.1 signal peptidase I [Ferrimonas lipolytica]